MIRLSLIFILVLFSLTRNGFSREEINYHNTLAITLAKKGMLDEAISEWEKVMLIDPSLAIPHYNLGLAYQKKGMLDEAMSEYKRAIEGDENYTAAHYNLGNAYNQKGLYSQAISQWNRVLEQDPNDGAARNNIKVVQNMLAEQSTPPALDLKGRQGTRRPQESGSPSAAQKYFDRGVESINDGKLDDAIKLLEEAVRIDPDFSKAYMEMGRAYHKKRMFAKARAAYQKALALEPDNKKAKFLLNVLK